jgi:DNA primase large subunit
LTGPQPGPGDAHGCPFRHFSPEVLIGMLEDELQIRDARLIKEIKEAVQGKHFHVACTKVFEATHILKANFAESISHPNQYFEQSIALAQDSSEN